MTEWHPIRVAARRTGLTPHVIRAWEKRYKAVEPRRTETNRRLYSTEDVERLALLRRGTLAGRSIGQIAERATEDLRRIVEQDEAAQRAIGKETLAVAPPATSEKGKLLEACLDAAASLDARRMERALDDAAVSLSRPALLSDVLVPLMHTIGDQWRTGQMRAAHEHLATAVVRTFVGNMNGAFETPSTAPQIVITTPSGQLHELGALLVGATAAADGWKTVYLGPSLPADEIAGAVRQNAARAVALSIVYPTDDPAIHGELVKLAKYVPDETRILIGGRGAPYYRPTIEQVGAVLIPDLAALQQELDTLRAP